MRALLIIIIFALSYLAIGLTSCSKRALSESSDIKDSIHIEYKDRLIEVPVPGDTVEVEKRIECDSVTNKPKPFSLKKKSGRATIHLKVNSSGVLSATGVCDSLLKVINAKDKEIYQLRKETKTRVEVKTEFKTRPIDKFCRWFSVIIILMMIGYSYLRIKKFI